MINIPIKTCRPCKAVMVKYNGILFLIEYDVHNISKKQNILEEKTLTNNAKNMTI